MADYNGIATAVLAVAVSVSKMWDYKIGKEQDRKYIHSMKSVARQLSVLSDHINTVERGVGDIKIELFGMEGTDGMKSIMMSVVRDMNQLKKSGAFLKEDT